MSITAPSLPNDTPGRDNAGAAPSKPFRVPRVEDPQVVMARMRQMALRTQALVQDNKALRFACVTAGMMALIIAGSIVGKRPFTFGTLALFVIIVLSSAFSNVWTGLLLYLAYLNMEGMYKYTSEFHPVVYGTGPLLGVAVYIACGLGMQQKRAQQAKEERADADPRARLRATTEEDVGLPPFTPWVFGLIGIMVIELMNPYAASLVGSIAGMMVWYIIPAAFYFVAWRVVRTQQQLMGLMYLLLALATVISAYALFQFMMGAEWCYAHIPGLDSINKVGWYLKEGNKVENGAFRPAATAAIAGGYASLSSYGLLGALTVLLMPGQPTWRRVVVTALIPIFGVAIVISAVRTNAMALFIIVPMLLSLNVRTLRDLVKIYFATFAIGAVAIASFGIANNLTGGKLLRRYSTALSNPLDAYAKNRGYHFYAFMDATYQMPLGIGIQRGVTNWRGVRFANSQSSLRSLLDRETQWNAIQQDGGIFAVILLGGFCIAIIRQGYRINKQITDPYSRGLASFLYCCILQSIIIAFSGPALQGNTTFWLLCGSLVGLPRMLRRTGPKPEGIGAGAPAVAPLPAAARPALMPGAGS